MKIFNHDIHLPWKTSRFESSEPPLTIELIEGFDASLPDPREINDVRKRDTAVAGVRARCDAITRVANEVASKDNGLHDRNDRSGVVLVDGPHIPPVNIPSLGHPTSALVEFDPVAHRITHADVRFSKSNPVPQEDRDYLSSAPADGRYPDQELRYLFHVDPRGRQVFTVETRHVGLDRVYCGKDFFDKIDTSTLTVEVDGSITETSHSEKQRSSYHTGHR